MWVIRHRHNGRSVSIDNRRSRFRHGRRTVAPPAGTTRRQFVATRLPQAALASPRGALARGHGGDLENGRRAVVPTLPVNCMTQVEADGELMVATVRDSPALRARRQARPRSPGFSSEAHRTPQSADCPTHRQPERIPRSCRLPPRVGVTEHQATCLPPLPARTSLPLLGQFRFTLPVAHRPSRSPAPELL